MIARILSPFLRWLDRRIDARVAARDAVIVSGLAPRVAVARQDLTRALGLTARPASGEIVFIPNDVAEHLTDFRLIRQVGCRPRLERCDPQANVGLQPSPPQAR